ncbi:MAG: rRNA maturation RNase YbeY [Thermodesulfobacteriota bacterium]
MSVIPSCRKSRTNSTFSKKPLFQNSVRIRKHKSFALKVSGALDIQVRNDEKNIRVSLSFLRSKARRMLKILGWKKAGLSVLLVNDRKIRQLNRRYMNHDRATDVLAFGQLKPSYRKGEIPFLGDIVISLPTTRRQARQFGNSFLYELCFYLCHGILHLMGYRDKSRKEAQRMERIQKEILKKVRIES